MDLSHGIDPRTYVLESQEGHKSSQLDRATALSVCTDDKERLILGSLGLREQFCVGDYTWERIA